MSERVQSYSVFFPVGFAEFVGVPMTPQLAEFPSSRRWFAE